MSIEKIQDNITNVKNIVQEDLHLLQKRKPLSRNNLILVLLNIPIRFVDLMNLQHELMALHHKVLL